MRHLAENRIGVKRLQALGASPRFPAKPRKSVPKLRFVMVSSIFPIVLPITTCKQEHSPADWQRSAGDSPSELANDPAAGPVGEHDSRRRRAAGSQEFEGAKKENQAMRGTMWLMALGCGLLLSSSGCCGFLQNGGCGRGCGCDSCGTCDGECGPVRRRFTSAYGGCTAAGATPAVHAAAAVAASAAMVAAIAASGTSASIP